MLNEYLGPQLNIIPQDQKNGDQSFYPLIN